MGQRIHRRLDEGPLEPAEFRRTETGVDIACPACGETAPLDSSYAVDSAGVVFPVWKCPDASCQCLEWLSLESF